MTVVPISLLVISTIMIYMTSLYIDNLKQVNKVEVINEVNRTLNMMSQEFSVAAGYQVSLSSGIADSNGPPGGGAWQGNDNTPFSRVILKIIGTTHSLASANKVVVRQDQYGCSTAVMTQNPPHYTNTVFFVNGGNLYKRTLVQSSPPTLCQTLFQKSTCPAGAGGPTCPKDILLASNVDEFSVKYLVPTVSGSCPSGSTPASTDDNLAVCDVGDPEDASVITVKLGITRSAAGEPFSYSHRFTVRAFNRPLEL